MKIYAAFQKVEAQDDGTIIVAGIASTETVDADGEIIKASAIEAALPDFMRHGTGALREMHQLSAAGTVLKAEVTGTETLIEAHVVDPVAVKKVQAGVYKGFSIGGKVTGRDAQMRKTVTGVKLIEISLVDRPNNPDAVLSFWKVEGADDEPFEPGNEATLARADEMAKAAGNKPRKDFVAKARAALIAEHAAVSDDGETQVIEKVDPVAALDAALAKAGAITVAPVVVADGPVEFADLAKAGTALKLIGTSIGDQLILAKGLYTLERVACLMERVGSIASSVAWEEKSEGDTASPLPAMAVEIVGKVKDFLIAMATEETAELMAEIAETMPGLTITITEAPVEDMALASSILDLVKADTDLMEKAGARNSKGDAAKIQTMHDHAVELGAACSVKKADEIATLTADNERLAKAVETTVPKIEELAGKLEKMAARVDASETARAEKDTELAKAQAQIEHLLKQPEMAKGVLFAVDKGADGGGSAANAVTLQADIDAVSALPGGRARADGLIELARRARHS